MRLSSMCLFVALLASTVSALPQAAGARALSDREVRAPSSPDSADVMRDLAERAGNSLTKRGVGALNSGSYAGPNAGTTRIKGLQFLLHANGQYVAIDGLWGGETAGAVRNVQRARGLAIDGDPGPATLGSLAFQLSRGSLGNAVKAAQALLKAGLVIDGDFGGATYNAVVALQRARGLGQDGIVGRLTWSALFTNGPMGVAAPASNPKPATKPPITASDRDRCPAGQRASRKSVPAASGSYCHYDVFTDLPPNADRVLNDICKKHTACYGGCSFSKPDCDQILYDDIQPLCSQIRIVLDDIAKNRLDTEQRVAGAFPKRFQPVPPRLPPICDGRWGEQVSETNFHQWNKNYCVCT
ncbi:hypothetical protein CspeluHIS016_0505780 [Cutaneotrichosporon spelunceum]|uniref:Peptidoglycan binding-like domain-containing protein n=1 Tax=Cutaneotrichosporon spelunceum TaxID=1672016 RepID=A0AAD3TXV8_9TREE|nr:hypothetical protein CspeluHIS016_0505780 [Cutaneotrichosporon spelunceum]